MPDTTQQRIEESFERHHPAKHMSVLKAMLKDAGVDDGINRDSGLGLPLVALGPDSTRRIDSLLSCGRKPGRTMPSPTDGALLFEAKREAALAYGRLLNSLKTRDQIDAACEYMAAETIVRGLIAKGAAQ